MAKQPDTVLGIPLGKCKSPACQRDVVFATNIHSGHVVPLDPKALVFAVRRDGGGTRCLTASKFIELVAEKMGPEWHDVKLMVSHFATCSDPARFSKNKLGG